MSRVGLKIIPVPSGVSINISDDQVDIKGPKGELKVPYSQKVSVVQENGEISVKRHDDDKQTRALHGLYRALINSAIEGVTTGYSRKLELVGVGFRAELKGKFLALAIGYSHPVYFRAPDGVKVEVGTPTEIIVSGIDKQLVGQVAAKIRAIRKPEPYKGKGIRYSGEYIRRKAGKTASR